MNISKALRLSFVATMILILTGTIVSASPAWTGTGNYVQSLWQSILLSPDEYLAAELVHDIDTGGVPRPTDLPAIIGAGYTVNTMTRIGQTFLITSTRVWPLGTHYGHPTDANYLVTEKFRKGMFYLVDRDAILALTSPLHSKALYWMPPGQAAWIETDPASPNYAPTPDMDRMKAVGLLDAAGFTATSGVANPNYDSSLPWSAAEWRIDPTTGSMMDPIEHMTINPAEAPLTYEAALMMQDWWQTAGIPIDILASTFGAIVSRLTNSDLYDFQIIHGVGIQWGGTSPDILYDFTYSLNLPLWNFASMNRSMGSTTDAEALASDDADYWGEEMFKTLSMARVKKCAWELQNILRDHSPYLPLLLWNAFTCCTGPFTSPTRGTSQGYLGIVNAKGFGALSTYDIENKLLGRADVKGNDEMIWGLGETLDTLNPLLADTVYDWTLLHVVMEGLTDLNSYNHKYRPWGADPAVMDFDPNVGYTPPVTPWVGPGRPQIGGDGIYNAPTPPTFAYDPRTGRDEMVTYNGINVEDLVGSDMVGDDQLGARWIWKLRDDLYWHDSDPGPAIGGVVKFGDGNDGVVHKVTTADAEFMMNKVLIGQENERYFSTWWYVNNYTAIDTLKFEVYEERQYVFSFEGHDVAFLGPKHIWEGDLNLGDTDPNNDIHHQFWTGWQVSYMENMILKQNGMPNWQLSRLIGFGPYMYHISGPEGIGAGWQPGILTHIETNPAYFGTYTPWFGTGNPGRIKLGDLDLNQLVEYIVFPAQFVQLDDFNLVIAQFGYTWGPYVPYTIPP